ncbi:MAG TPA: lytic murein transglycosylase [Geminicoccaceae bacterium]|nr:lytic murein transglycosylase [Geminicoccaceae bacterium]
MRVRSWLSGRPLLGLAVLLPLAAAMAAPPSPALARDFAAWLEDFRDDALARGIRRETLDRALADVAPIPRVVELDRNQPERRFTFEEYRQRVLTPARIDQGRERFRRHRELLERVSAEYGVPPQVIVALWGIESSYGQSTGGYPVIASLATLAFDGRRAEFFRGELLNALTILDRGEIAPQDMTGSWAGAMGQSQFMPSSYLRSAVDFDGDGRRDIWTSLPDVFASMANYLARAGWERGYIWGRRVQAPGDLPAAAVGLEVRKPLPEWRRLGVRRADGGALPAADIPASLVRPDGADGARAYLAYHNFRVLLNWNRSTYFALAVGELADLIRDG